MDMPKPLQVHRGPDRILVMMNGLVISNLTQFQVRLKPPEPVLVHYVLTGHPNFTFNKAPEDALSNNAFPLRFHIGDDASDVIATYKSRPFSGITEVLIEVEHSAAKPIIRLTFKEEVAPPQEVRDWLVKLGVEVVVDHAPV
jgi:hypothetical protein